MWSGFWDLFCAHWMSKTRSLGRNLQIHCVEDESITGDDKKQDFMMMAKSVAIVVGEDKANASNLNLAKRELSDKHKGNLY